MSANSGYGTLALVKEDEWAPIDEYNPEGNLCVAIIGCDGHLNIYLLGDNRIWSTDGIFRVIQP